MTRTSSGNEAATLDPTPPERRVADAARRVYEAEIALHDAHQAHVDAWISAANDRLHVACEAHRVAAQALSRA